MAGIIDSYDRVASAYADAFVHELDGKPLDRALLAAFAEEVRGRGLATDHLGFPRPLSAGSSAERLGSPGDRPGEPPAPRPASLVADLGCGPGHVGAALAAHGVEVEGVDLSAAMLDVGRARFPGLRFVQADLRALPYADGALAGAVAFYAIVHLPTDELRPVFTELARVLAPGASALVTFHVGTDVLHLDTWFDQPVDATWYFHPVDAVLRAADGFTADVVADRAPYPSEHPTRRAYLWLRRHG